MLMGCTRAFIFESRVRRGHAGEFAGIRILPNTAPELKIVSLDLIHYMPTQYHQSTLSIS